MEEGGLLGQASVLTTHHAAQGVAAGVVQVLRELLERTGLDPGRVALVAHSTTQATNALLEGDWAPVGIVAMGPERQRARILRRATPEAIDLVPGKALPTTTRFVATDRGLAPEVLEAVLTELAALGCRAVVATEAFSVEDPRHEQDAVLAARRRGLAATAGSDVTGSYGLEVRTTTAALNASILPRMIETAEMVERSLERTLPAPLLILKGDGGVTSMETFRTQPLVTLFSGPAAGLSGALKLRPLLHALSVEVGGTSTNVGIVRDGQIALRYARIGDFATCVRAADVQVVGVAGGSLLRLQGRSIAAVGPRSAHIAGLPYAAFTPAGELAGAELARVTPLPGDPAGYTAVRTRDGGLMALTPTCAANALGLLPAGDHARGDGEAARLAFAPLAAHLRCSVEAAARALLEQAARQVEEAVRDLLRAHDLRADQLTLLMGGGGAMVLGPALAARLGTPAERLPHAEVVSSIGAALGMLRIEREQALARPSPEALAALRQEVEAALLEMGAAPDSLMVQTEFVPERMVVRAVATASLAFARPGAEALPATALRALAARALGRPEAELRCPLRTGGYSVFEATVRRGLWRRPANAVAVVDRRGALPLVVDGEVLAGPSRVVAEGAGALLRRRRERWGLAPEVRLVLPHRLVDLSALTAIEQVEEAIERELGAARGAEAVALVVGTG
jgi:N-methylhydantoinase A/oxoprolinase/acetone carboxylase beta subunit